MVFSLPPDNALPDFDVLFRNVTGAPAAWPTGVKCDVNFKKNKAACEPLFCNHFLGCFGGTAAAGERKQTRNARSDKQICVNDIHLEMVPFLFSVPGQYSRAGI